MQRPALPYRSLNHHPKLVDGHDTKRVASYMYETHTDRSAITRMVSTLCPAVRDCPRAAVSLDCTARNAPDALPCIVRRRRRVPFRRHWNRHGLGERQYLCASQPGAVQLSSMSRLIDDSQGDWSNPASGVSMSWAGEGAWSGFIPQLHILLLYYVWINSLGSRRKSHLRYILYPVVNGNSPSTQARPLQHK
jgi:hypothetical protein